MDETAIVPTEELNQIAMPMKPDEILSDATVAAKSLQNVIKNKRKPVIFNGEQYLEFEDWQTVGRFYGLASKIEFTKYVEYGEVKGWEAHATVIDTKTGREISSADSMCLNDERNWSSKPLFQLRSMAQTRACAKALRNVLAWVAVLAGYKPTPAEEMNGVHTQESKQEVVYDYSTPTPRKHKDSPVDVSDDQLGNWEFPNGKYKGQKLIQIIGDVTGTGKNKGMEYLEWYSENAKNETQKDIVSRFIQMMNQV